MKTPPRAPVVLVGLIGLTALVWAIQLTGGVDGSQPMLLATR
jgi:hypothetical protein